MGGGKRYRFFFRELRLPVEFDLDALVNLDAQDVLIRVWFVGDLSSFGERSIRKNKLEQEVSRIHVFSQIIWQHSVARRAQKFGWGYVLLFNILSLPGMSFIVVMLDLRPTRSLKRPQ